MKIIATAAGAALSLGVALAQAQSVEKIGEVRMAFEGQEQVFAVERITHEGRTVSTAYVENAGARLPSLKDVETLVITGMVKKDRSAVLLQQMFRGKPSNEKVSDLLANPHFNYYTRHKNPPIWSSGAEGKQHVQFEFDKFEFDGERGHVSGTFAGQLCRIDNPQEGELDPGDCRDVSGSFDTRLYPGE